MKTKVETIDYMFQLKTKLGEYERQYRELNQIDMQSHTGNDLLEKINKLKGEINGLNWVITK